jgi:hypothetical protein
VLGVASGFLVFGLERKVGTAVVHAATLVYLHAMIGERTMEHAVAIHSTTALDHQMITDTQATSLGHLPLERAAPCHLEGRHAVCHLAVLSYKKRRRKKKKKEEEEEEDGQRIRRSKKEKKKKNKDKE